MSDFEALTAGYEALLDGGEAGIVELGSSEENRAAALAMARRASRSIRIVSRHLDPPIYDTAEFADAVRDVVLGSRRARVDIIVLDPAPLARSGHRILRLAHRVTSFMELRIPGPEHSSYNTAMLIVDEMQTVVRKFSDRYEGAFSYGDRTSARPLVRTFDGMWEVAVSHPALRRLTL